MKKILIIILFLIPIVSNADTFTIEDKINTERKYYNLDELKIDPQLKQTSAFKVNDMIFHKYFAHINPFGDGLKQIFKRFNVKYRYGGEILARGFSNDDITIYMWMNSETHKNIILDKDFTKIGCYSRNEIIVCHFK